MSCMQHYMLSPYCSKSCDVYLYCTFQTISVKHKIYFCNRRTTQLPFVLGSEARKKHAVVRRSSRGWGPLPIPAITVLLFPSFCSHLQTPHPSPVSPLSAQSSHSASYHFVPQNILVCYCSQSLRLLPSRPIAVMHAIPLLALVLFLPQPVI